MGRQAFELVTSPVVLEPEADTYVRSSAYAGRNYGTETALKASLSDGGTIEGGALRFSVGEVGTVASARLRLYVVDGSSDPADLKLLASQAWSELAVTWSSMPPTSGALATIRAASPGTWVEVDVTSSVRAGAKISFALVPRSADTFAVSSREAVSNRPQLVLALAATGSTCGDGACTATESCATCPADCRACPPSSSSSLTLAPEADTYIRSGAYAALNFGGEAVLKASLADGGTVEGGAVRFRVGQVGHISSATLRLYVAEGSGNAADIKALSSSTWGESTTTWNARPAADGTVLGSIGAASAGTWVEVPVTSAVSAGAAVSLAIAPRSSDGVSFASREDASHAPQLVLVTAAASTCGDGTCSSDESCLSCAADCACALATTVLFIGNSYTYTNDLPGMVEELARAGGRASFFQDSVTVGGATLQDLWGDGNSAAVQRIASRAWSHVVLQEHSERPIAEREIFFQYARLFEARIRAAGAQTVFYLPWAHLDELQNQAVLTDAYQTIATELGATVAPVGPAWVTARQRYPDLALYQSDGSHPLPTGTYLAALVFYSKLFGQNPVGLPGRIERGRLTLVDLSADPARVAGLQDIAWTTVLGFRP